MLPLLAQLVAPPLQPGHGRELQAVCRWLHQQPRHPPVESASRLTGGSDHQDIFLLAPH